MNDFLSKFSKNNYDDLIEEEQEESQQQEAVVPSVTQDIVDIDNPVDEANMESVDTADAIVLQDNVGDKSDNNERSDTDISVSLTSSSTIQEVQRSKRSRVGMEEITEVDTGYNKKQVRKYALIGVAIVLISASIFGGVVLLNRVTVPNFIGKNMTEVKSWGLKNRIEIEVTEAFSVEQDAAIVLQQAKSEKQKIQKGSVFSITVSKGPDPDEKITIPDFNAMKGNEIENWKTKNKAENAKIIKEFSDTAENGKLLRMEYKDPGVSAETYRRKDTLTLYVSKGKEVFEKNIAMPNFVNKLKAEVETWVKSNDIDMTYEEVESATVAAGAVVSQSVGADTKVAKKDKMTVQISLGQAIIVPWFGNISMTNAPSALPGASVNVKQQYSASVAYGTLISQSVASGTRLLGNEPKDIEVVYSVGRPYIDDLRSMSEKELAAYFYEYSNKGASITYTVHYVSSSSPRGQVVDASRYSQFVDLKTHVDVYVSQG